MNMNTAPPNFRQQYQHHYQHQGPTSTSFGDSASSSIHRTNAKPLKTKYSSIEQVKNRIISWIWTLRPLLSPIFCFQLSTKAKQNNMTTQRTTTMQWLKQHHDCNQPTEINGIVKQKKEFYPRSEKNKRKIKERRTYYQNFCFQKECDGIRSNKRRDAEHMTITAVSVTSQRRCAFG